MCECLKISDGSAHARRDPVLDEWTMTALRQNMSIVACHPESGDLLGKRMLKVRLCLLVSKVPKCRVGGDAFEMYLR